MRGLPSDNWQVRVSANIPLETEKNEKNPNLILKQFFKKRKLWKKGLADDLKNSRNTNKIINQIKMYLKYIFKLKILFQFPMDCI